MTAERGPLIWKLENAEGDMRAAMNEAATYIVELQTACAKKDKALKEISESPFTPYRIQIHALQAMETCVVANRTAPAQEQSQ